MYDKHFILYKKVHLLSVLVKDAYKVYAGNQQEKG